jgi:hypothetical protein
VETRSERLFNTAAAPYCIKTESKQEKKQESKQASGELEGEAAGDRAHTISTGPMRGTPDSDSVPVAPSSFLFPFTREMPADIHGKNV